MGCRDVAVSIWSQSVLPVDLSGLSQGLETFFHGPNFRGRMRPVRLFSRAVRFSYLRGLVGVGFDIDAGKLPRLLLLIATPLTDENSVKADAERACNRTDTDCQFCCQMV